MIHSTAIINKNAKIGKNVDIGPYVVIENGVEILDGTKIGLGVQLKKGVKIGKENKLFEYVSIGNPPQDVKFKGEEIHVKIGNHNLIREFVSIHGGSGETTIVGDNNFLMAYVHIAHNCKLGNKIVIANATQISGFVTIEDGAFISGLCPIHQFVRIGCYSMIAGGYRVPKDVIPYALAASDPLRIHGLNIVGLKRNGFKPETIKVLKTAFNILLFSGFNTSQAITRIKEDLPPIPEVTHLITFIENSKRGIAK
jgi:UDP-N-acetylglucosamine acyltransferase